MNRKVLKFGGSSIGSPERVVQVGDIILDSPSDAVVIFSAFGGMTDQLITLSRQSAAGDESYLENQESLETEIFTYAKTLIPPKLQSKTFARLKATLNELEDILHGVHMVKELTPRTRDYVMSFGERITADLICEYLKTRGADAEYVDTRRLIKTDTNFGNARVEFQQTNSNLQEYFDKHMNLQVVTGFIGSTGSNEVTTLGRSGSDYTATIIGAAIGAPEIEIWTDVNGIMTADPRKVPNAFPQTIVSYEEAMEMSHFGARVIHPSAMQPAFEQGIPIRIRNSFNPEFPGTVISADHRKTPHLISGISSIEHIALLRVQGSGMLGVTGIAGRLFGSLAEHDINIILITQASSEHTICFAVAPEQADRAKEVIEEEFSLEVQTHHIDPVVVENNLSVVAAVGENMRHTPGIAGRLFRILGNHQVNVVAIAQGSSELNISAVVSREDEVQALNAIHRTFFNSDHEEIHIFLAGTGLVGGTLLQQIAESTGNEDSDASPRIKLAGLTNSRQMAIRGDGIAPNNWETVLADNGEKANTNQFLEEIKRLRLPGSVFVDCTASETLSSRYLELLESGIPVVTANKKANSGPYETFADLSGYARKSRPEYLYETNVGAGLPVISTLRSLRKTGDRIRKIEGVLSGTLSYIFNTFDSETPFSEIVRIAQEKGYTEPDPRDDLDGMDVARKILILARESGYLLELDDVTVDQFLPENCFTAKDQEEFFRKVGEADKGLEERRSRAESNGRKLRYIASLDEGEVTVGLQEVADGHPCYNLQGSDNIIAITTERYQSTPLVIQGPGAGPEVTASGLFADIITAGAGGKNFT